MSYTISLTNGTVLTEVVDGSIDQLSTDLTLIGKNATSYGSFIDENFVKLLENFANINQPNYPLTGQLWYDTSENRLKIFDGATFAVTGGSIVSNTLPPTISTGDIWINSDTEQLFFNDGKTTLLAGPIYTSQQGISGFSVIDVLDTNSITRTIVLLSVAQTLIGIYSKDAFIPATPIAGYTGPINIGFNVGNTADIKFNVDVTSADTLVASDGSLKTPSDFLSASGNAATDGTLSIQNSTPLILGTAASTEVNVNTSLFQIKANTINQNFDVSVLNSGGLTSGLFIDASSSFVGLFNNTPQYTLDVTGIIHSSDTIIAPTVSTDALILTGNNITLGAVTTPSNSTANTGGLTVAAGTDGDKTFEWLSSTLSWTSSENINILIGKTYKINGQDVLSSTALAPSVTSALGLSSIGTLNQLQVSSLSFDNNVISYINLTQANGNVVLTPKGTGSVDVSNTRITSVDTPVDTTDATNKTYVDSLVLSRNVAISLTTTGLTDVQIAADYLQVIFPSGEYIDNTLCRAVCTDGTATTIREYKLVSGTWTFQTTL